MSLQVCEGCYRAEETGYCARAWIRGDSGACIWRRPYEWKCGSRHPQNAQAATLEGQLMNRHLLAFLEIHITWSHWLQICLLACPPFYILVGMITLRAVNRPRKTVQKQV